jgi:hypothetical protein
VKPLYAVITPEAARDVAEHLERTIPSMCPLPDTQAWVDVMNALYALSNDTDFIVTDEAVVPDVTPGVTDWVDRMNAGPEAQAPAQRPEELAKALRVCPHCGSTWDAPTETGHCYVCKGDGDYE